MHESRVVSFSQKVLAESGAWCIFTAFWGEQQAVAAIVAAACIFCEILRVRRSVCGPSYEWEGQPPFRFGTSKDAQSRTVEFGQGF